MRRPWIVPSATPPARVASIATGQENSWLTRRSRKMMPSSASMEPTESSMPPVMITMPRPSANSPNRPIWLARLTRFTCEMNCGLMKAVTEPMTRISRKRPSSFLSIVVAILRACSANGQHQHIVLREVGAVEKSSHATLMHHGDAIADADDLLHVARDHQDGDAGISQRAHQAIDLALGADIDAARRLVEDD